MVYWWGAHRVLLLHPQITIWVLDGWSRMAFVEWTKQDERACPTCRTVCPTRRVQESEVQ